MDTLNQRIGHFYDRSTQIWLDTWGEHMHHGYYGPDGKAKKSHLQAQIDLIEELLSFGEVKTATRIFDAGCGVGGSSRYLARKFGATSLGVTLSEVQAQQAAVWNEQAGLTTQVEIRKQDMTTITAADGPFDLVWSMESAEHIREKQQLFNQFFTLLQPGGRLVMATWCHRETPPGLSSSEQALLQSVYDLYHLPPMVSGQDLKKMAETAGFQEVEMADWSDSVSPFWTAVLRSAMSLRSVAGLIRSGWPTLKGAWAMQYMIRGYRRGLIKFIVVKGKKA